MKVLQIKNEKVGKKGVYLFGKRIFKISGFSNSVLYNEIIGIWSYLNSFISVDNLGEAHGWLRDIQLADLKILKEINRICIENKLTYWIDFGTLLGAVRHKGFIPWDDDIDICMVRNDYEKFVDIFNKSCKDEKLEASWYYSKQGSIFIKVALKDAPDNVFVDIFPIDMCYKSMDIEEKLEFSTHIKKLAVKASKNKMTNALLHRDGVKRLRDENISNLTGKLDINNATIFYGLEFHHETHRFNAFDYNTIFPLNVIEFEGCKFPCVNDLDSYLTMIFGNYMTIPHKIFFHTDLAKIDIKTMLEIKNYIRD